MAGAGRKVKRKAGFQYAVTGYRSTLAPLRPAPVPH